MRRIAPSFAALALVAGIHLAGAAPAQAATPAVEWTTPGPNGALAANSFTFSAHVYQPNGTLVNDIVVEVAPGQQGGKTFTRPSGNQASVVVTEPITLPRNGSYQAIIRASGRSGVIDNDTSPRTFTNTFTVDAPPVAPGGVRATVNTKTRVVTVTWAANPEPDVVGYEVEQESPSGRWTTIAATDKTSVVDESTADAGGTYRYHVRAFRQSAQQGKLNPSAYSATASARVADPPATTTTTRATDGGSSTGGSTSTEEGGSSGQAGGSDSGSGSGSGSEAGRGPGAVEGRRSVLSTGDKVDLSDFSALVEQSRSQQPGGGSEEEDDGTFDEKLPFKARTGGEQEGDDVEGEEALGEEPASDAGGNLQAMGFLAGGLLATVLAMHVLWVRSEVHRAEALEALIPVDVVEAPPAAGRRRRPSPVVR